MKSINKAPRTTSGMLEWLDSVRMTDANREIAKNQVRMSEAVIDAAWRAGRYIRAAIAGRPAKPAREKLGGSEHIASGLR